MFINQHIVAIFFKLINFAILVGLITYIFKKYIKTNIIFLIAKKESDHQQLLLQQTVLEDKQRNLDLLMQEEIIQSQNFKSKIDQWKKVVISEQEKQKEKYSKFLNIMEKRNAEITLKKEQQRIHNNIINIVVSDLEKSLSHDFKSPEKGAHYLADIISFMKEKAS